MSSPYLVPGGVVAGGVGLALSGPLGAIALVSLGVGVGVYLHHQGRLYIRWLPWQRWWHPVNRSLTQALLSGAAVAAIGLLLLAVWQRSPWPGLMTVVMAQTAVMAVMAQRRFHSGPRSGDATATASANADGHDEALEAILTALAAEHPIHQLVAIRRARRWLKANDSQEAAEAIAASFTLLLRRTQDPEIRQRLQQGLAQIKPAFALPKRETRYEAAPMQPATFAMAAAEPAVVPSTVTVPTDC